MLYFAHYLAHLVYLYFSISCRPTAELLVLLCIFPANWNLLAFCNVHKFIFQEGMKQISSHSFLKLRLNNNDDNTHTNRKYSGRICPIEYLFVFRNEKWKNALIHPENCVCKTVFEKGPLSVPDLEQCLYKRKCKLSWS